MFEKLKKLDPLTKQTIIACTIQATILVGIAVVAVKLDSSSKTPIEN